MLKKFPNEGIVGPDYSALVVECLDPEDGVIFTPLVGSLGADALADQAKGDGFKAGDELPNILLQPEAVAALIALLQQTRPTQPVEVATPVIDGVEIGEKRYALWVSHNEIHMLYWALKTAETIVRRDPSFLDNNALVYIKARSAVEFDTFVTHFDNVHRQARIDDGEDLGVKSNAETPPADLHSRLAL